MAQSSTASVDAKLLQIIGIEVLSEKKKDISTACNGTIKCKTAHEKNSE